MKRFIAALSCLLLAGTIRPSRADDASSLQALVEKTAPAIVTVKVVLRVSQSSGSQSRDQESKMDVQGVVVDKEGIVMISNMPFSLGRVNEMLGNGGSDSSDFRIVPTDFKIIFEQEDKEYSAFLAATDSKTDLAFLKIENLGERKLTPIDFSSSQTALIGQEVVAVTRLHKGYDLAPYFETSRICGVVSKPRKAYLLEGGIESVGLPVFMKSGANLGVLTTLTPTVKDEELTESIGFRNRYHQVLGGKSGLVFTFVVPGQVVNTLITQAKARAITVAAERAKKHVSSPPKASAPSGK